jgi:hypothetical protein
VRRPLALACIGAVFIISAVRADDLSVQADPRADFSIFKTFALKGGRIDSARPELDNPLFAKMLARTISRALIDKGLKEAQDRPDLIVEYSLTGEDFSVGRPTGVRGMGPRPVRFTEGTLVIDMTRPGETAHVWRGVYRDDEQTGSKLVQKLPEDARKLIGRYPKSR